MPSRAITLDLGHLGKRTSIGQFALVAEDELVGKNVVACVNLGSREIGPHRSEALVLGAPHPQGPDDQAQATPLFVADTARPGDQIF
jgi:tRNA-binding protein